MARSHPAHACRWTPGTADQVIIAIAPDIALQIAGHSWGHMNLTSLNETQLVNQVQYLEMALRNILGFIPTYFRPPYDDCQGLCPTVLKRMGYHISKCYDWYLKCKTNAIIAAYQNVVNNGMWLSLSS
jgi:peptidoglycan/xylan/chitin deacetylase (PgdA/CDA1 family)